MLSLEDAIKHCELKVVMCEQTGQPMCAEDHRQLAEWLKELKAYKDKGKECAFCQHLGEKQICGRCRTHNLYAPMTTNKVVGQRTDDDYSLDEAVEYADNLLGELKGSMRLLKGSDCPWK